MLRCLRQSTDMTRTSLSAWKLVGCCPLMICILICCPGGIQVEILHCLIGQLPVPPLLPPQAGVHASQSAKNTLHNEANTHRKAMAMPMSTSNATRPPIKGPLLSSKNSSTLLTPCGSGSTLTSFLETNSDLLGGFAGSKQY
jgi:hypothetical protein